MNEDTVKKIFKIYLEKSEGKPIKEKKKQVHGPDFELPNGWAYECEGSKLKEKEVLDQILRWSPRFSVINLVLPYDALKNFRFIWQLEALEKFIRESPDLEKPIGIYLIAEMGNQKYAICNFHFARSLNSEISNILYKLIPNFTDIDLAEKEKRIYEFLDDIESRIKDEFRKLTIQKASESKNILEGGIIQV